MRKKKLLSETQVRRFMGLAGIKPLNEMSHYKMDDEEPLMEEEDMEMDAEEPDMEAGDADVEMDEEDLADVKSALDTLQDKLGPLLDQAAGGDMDMEDDEGMDMDDEAPDMDMDAGDEAPDMEDEEDMDKELQEVDMELTEDEIVSEVARRVAKRIVEAKRAHKKMNEALGRRTVKGARPKLRRR